MALNKVDLFNYSSQKYDFKSDFNSLYSDNLPSYDKANDLFSENYIGSKVYKKFSDNKLYDAPNKKISETIDMSRRNFRRLTTKVPFVNYVAKKDYFADTIKPKDEFELKYNTIKGFSSAINDKLDLLDIKNKYDSRLDLSDKLFDTDLKLKGEKKLVLDSIYLGSNTDFKYKEAKKEFDKSYLVEAFKSYGNDSTLFEKYVGRSIDSMKNKAKSLDIDFKYFTEQGINQRRIEESISQNPFVKYFVDDKLGTEQTLQNQQLSSQFKNQPSTSSQTTISNQPKSESTKDEQQTSSGMDEDTQRIISELHQQINSQFQNLKKKPLKKKKKDLKKINDDFINKDLNLVF